MKNITTFGGIIPIWPSTPQARKQAKEMNLGPLISITGVLSLLNPSKLKATDQKCLESEQKAITDIRN